MPQRGNSRDPKSIEPEIKSLGHWPQAEENIRELALQHGIPSDAIEPFLDEIRNARFEGSKETKAWPYLADVELAYLKTVLSHTKGDKQAAARLMNIDRKTLDRMLRRQVVHRNETQSNT